MDLQAHVISLPDVTGHQRDEMYALMQRYYAGMRRETFEHDLNMKDWIIEITDPDSGHLCGFSTQVLWTVTSPDTDAKVLFSGDTIVDRRCWGNNPLAQTWGRFALSLIDQLDGTGTPLYWFLIVKGYKTYRFLPLFFREFYPRCECETPRWAWEMIGRLGDRHWPAQFDAQSGIIRAATDSCRLRRGVADVTAIRLRDPHVRFFATRNPQHTVGDELCCIAPLTRENFTAAARRVIGHDVFAATVKT